MLGSLIGRRMVLVAATVLFAGLLSILFLWTPASGAATGPTGFKDFQIATGLHGPTAMEFAPDDPDDLDDPVRLFVAEIGGTILIIENGTLLEEPFVTIPDVEATSGAGDGRGLLGITFDPDFSTNNFVYVHYTQVGSDGQPSHNRIVRFTANVEGGEPDLAVEQDGIGHLIFQLDNLGRSGQHNGGHIHFNDEVDDEKLYIPVGDNKRNKFPPFLKTMKLTNLFGKVLRINADGSIPDNPFNAETTGKYQAIYARGFRNPFSFAVEPAEGQDLHQRRG
jgi:glucose/arabinose dehydrogenase